MQSKDLNNPIPHCLTLEGLFDGNAFDVRGFDSMQTADRVF